METGHFGVRLRLFLRGAMATGLVRTVSARVGRLARDAVLWAALLPVTLVLHAAGFRRLSVITSRIGHLAAEVDCFLKARALGELAPRRHFLLAPAAATANAHLLGYWRNHLRVVSNPLACLLLNAMSRWRLMRHDVGHYVLRLNATQDMYRLNALWPPRPPLLRLSTEDCAWADEALQRLGLPPGAWFVCVHAREAGFSPADDEAHAHRNGDPRALVPAMRLIAERGGWCVRMGDPTMTPLPDLPNTIDYAGHPLKSDRMDVVLCARARFFLGNTSGLALVSTVFGVPSALVNMVPTSTLAPLRGDLSIPKLLYGRSADRLLRFDEIFAAPVANYRYSALYREAGVELRENTPEEIAEIVREMLDTLDGATTPSAQDEELQRRYMRLLRPGHYSWGAASRVGAAFLRRHADLIGDE